MDEPKTTQPRVIAGRYELESLIGKGGIAEVWRARHLALNSSVAIKFLQGASAQNETTRKRFTTEAQVTAQLKSQHAVQVFDFGVTDEGQPYLVMELLEGETLGRRLERQGRLDVLETARLLGQSARALHRAHQLGIVHRDFKPDNIVIGADDEGRDYVKVVDFGIAKLVGDLEPVSQSPPTDLGTTAPPVTFTKTGAMLGTPFYMAPEQVRNAAEVDLRADIWAFGVVAFECLTGVTPFSGETLLELFQRIESGKHPDADKLEPSVPSGFHAWFDIACAPDPRRRFPDAQTAWKKLLVALECGKIDLDPSIARSLTTSGENRLSASGEQHVIRGHTNTADGNAVTVDAPPRKGVEPRRHKSVRAIPAALPAAAATRTMQSEPPRAPQAPDEREAIAAEATAVHDPLVTTMRRRRGGRRDAAALLVALAVMAIIVVVGWRVTSSPTPAPAPARIETATSAIAPAALPPSPATEEAKTPPPTSPPEPVSPPAPSVTAKAQPRGRPRGPTPPSPAAPASSAGARVIPPPPAPPSATPAPPPTTTVADPSSYR